MIFFAGIFLEFGIQMGRNSASEYGLAGFGGLDGTWRNGGMMEFICDQGYPLLLFLPLIGVLHVARRDGHAESFWLGFDFEICLIRLGGYAVSLRCMRTEYLHAINNEMMIQHNSIMTTELKG